MNVFVRVIRTGEHASGQTSITYSLVPGTATEEDFYPNTGNVANLFSALFYAFRYITLYFFFFLLLMYSSIYF